MAAPKKKQPASPGGAWLRGVFSWLLGQGRPALIVLILVGVFGGGACLAWLKLKDRILAAPEYLVGPEQVEVTEQPPWIPRSDVRAEVLRSLTLDRPLSLMDDDLIDRINAAFARHPWVARVSRVAKEYGSVKVDLVYRKPVCMVEVPGGRLPVDVDAVLLPWLAGDITPLESDRYPLLVRVDPNPTASAGSRWADAKVIGGAEIAAVLVDVWEPMRLYYIEPLPSDPTVVGTGGVNVPSAADNSAGRSAEPFFTLVTRGNTPTRVLWGYAPGANALGELTAAEKVARLKKYFAVNDTLDGPQGVPQTLDVRKLPPPVQP